MWLVLQVGLIAVNIIGDPLEVPSYSQDHDAVSDIIACDEVFYCFKKCLTKRNLLIPWWGQITKKFFDDWRLGNLALAFLKIFSVHAGAGCNVAVV